MKNDDSEKSGRKGVKVVTKRNGYLELYKSSSNINIKTKPSKKRLRTVKKGKKDNSYGGIIDLMPPVPIKPVAE